jgi:hypothetical protein
MGVAAPEQNAGARLRAVKTMSKNNLSAASIPGGCGPRDHAPRLEAGTAGELPRGGLVPA